MHRSDATKFHMYGAITVLCYVSCNYNVGRAAYHIRLLFLVRNQHFYCATMHLNTLNCDFTCGSTVESLHNCCVIKITVSL